MEEKKQPLSSTEIEEKAKELNEYYEKFINETSKDIVKILMDENYPIEVAIGGLTTIVASLIQTYELKDIIPNCIEILENSAQEIEQ